MQSDSEKKKQKIVNFIKLLSQIDQEKVKSERVRFQEDFKKHGSGLLLWAKEEYSNSMQLSSVFYGGIFDKLTKTFLLGMKKVVDEYFTLHDDVKARNPDLYQEEMKESNELVFEKTIQPMDLLVAKDPYIKKINRKLSGGLKTLKPQILDYFDKLHSEFTSYGDKIKEQTDKLSQMEDLESKLRDLKSGKISLSKLIESAVDLKKVGDQLKSISLDFQNINKETSNKIKELQKDTLPYLPKLNREFKNIVEDLKETYDVNDPSWAHQRLLLVKDFDSFHIIFTKFIARLFHILSHNNRDYTKKIPEIDAKKHHPDTRNKLKQILKLEMKQKYPKLSEYLLSMFKYNKYRKIDAHEVPKIRMSNGIAYIPLSGTNKEVKMNLEKIKTMLNTYSYFIRALNLVSNYTLK